MVYIVNEIFYYLFKYCAKKNIYIKYYNRSIENN